MITFVILVGFAVVVWFAFKDISDPLYPVVRKEGDHKPYKEWIT